MSMELTEIGRVKENRPCRHEGRIGFTVNEETSEILVGKGDEPMNRLRDLIGVGMTQELGREAEQLSQRAEQTLILMNLQLSLRVGLTPILKGLELSRRVEQVPIMRDLGTILRDLGTVLMDLGRMRRMV